MSETTTIEIPTNACALVFTDGSEVRLILPKDAMDGDPNGTVPYHVLLMTAIATIGLEDAELMRSLVERLIAKSEEKLKNAAEDTSD